MFLSLGSFELFSQEGEKKGLRNHFGFFWSLSASWRQCGSPCAGIQVLCGCCRSQFHVLPDKARCGFSRGAGMSSESLLSCSAVTGTYLSILADNICLLRLLVSLLEFLLPPAMFPALEGAPCLCTFRGTSRHLGICKFLSLGNGSL